MVPNISRKPIGCVAAKPQSPGHALRIKTEQLAGGGSGAEHPSGSGDVPPHFVMGREYCFAYPALSFDSEHERIWVEPEITGRGTNRR
jgi:hypothetical protein